MSKTVFFNTYKLKKGAHIPDFLLAVDDLNQGYIAKQKGYVSFELLVDGETWADATTFETAEDAKKFASSSEPNKLAEAFYAFINLNSCKTHYFSVEKSY